MGFFFCLSLINVDMHDLHLIHTDLKPENILLVSSEYVKVPSHKVFHPFAISFSLGSWNECRISYYLERIHGHDTEKLAGCDAF